MTAWTLLAFGLQGLAMVFDELYFHRKRGLPRWEKIGHPLDTLTVLSCYLLLLTLSPANDSHQTWILITMIGSCLFITKDEFVHTGACEGAENWLHSILFILHPVIFYLAYSIWIKSSSEGLSLLTAQTLIVFSFFCYQIIYWSFFGKRQQRNL